MKLIGLTEKEKKNALNEVRILASINHPSIIAYKEAFIEKQFLYIVMEYAEGGALSHKIKEKIDKREFFSESEIWSCFVQLLKGLESLHDLNIMHRDIKCANIFLDKQGRCKLGDLNVSKVVKNGLVFTQTGTPYYASPEVWRDKPYDSRSDIWSLGCVIYEMTALAPPFTANDMKGLYKKVTKGIYSKIPSRYSSELAIMISQCLIT